VDFTGRSEPAAVVGLLEVLGLNYALILDRSGNRVQTLVVIGAGTTSAGRPTVTSAPAAMGSDLPSFAEQQAMEEGRMPIPPPRDPPPPERMAGSDAPSVDPQAEAPPEIPANEPSNVARPLTLPARREGPTKEAKPQP